MKIARLGSKMTQEALAGEIGAYAPNVSAWESGDKVLGIKVASKAAEALGEDAAQLIAENRLKVIERAKQKGDGPAALKAAMDVVKIAESRNLTPQQERDLEAFVDGVIEFATKTATDLQHYSQIPDEGRTILGVKTASGKSAVKNVA